MHISYASPGFTETLASIGGSIELTVHFFPDGSKNSEEHGQGNEDY